MNTSSLLSLLHISSPALPIGTFAYSQGLEYTLDRGWCRKADDVAQWISAVLKEGLGGVDLPIMVRLYHAWQQGSEEDLNYWNDTLLAFRETKELYLEDVQVGEAFKQWHMSWIDEDTTSELTDGQFDTATHQRMLNWIQQPTVPVMYTLSSVLQAVDVKSCLIGFTWAWLENQITAASKAMPMGQTDGQRIIRKLLPEIEQVVEQALKVEDELIGSGLVGLAMSSALHEHQYSRLFRS